MAGDCAHKKILFMELVLAGLKWKEPKSPHSGGFYFLKNKKCRKNYFIFKKVINIFIKKSL